MATATTLLEIDYHFCPATAKGSVTHPSREEWLKYEYLDLEGFLAERGEELRGGNVIEEIDVMGYDGERDGQLVETPLENYISYQDDQFWVSFARYLADRAEAAEELRRAAAEEEARRKKLPVAMQPCKSSMLSEMGYLRSASTLFVRFRNNGAVYAYFGVPAEHYYRLRAVASIGRYMQRHILERYTGARVSSGAA
jgi:hypothetical protein